MKTCAYLLCLAALASNVSSQSLYFPPLTGSAWDTLSPVSLGWDTAKTDTLYRFLEEKNTRAFLVLKDGRIVLERYFATFTADSSWYWASAGKTITAFALGLAQQQGRLSIGDTSSKWLGSGWTSCPPDKENRITVYHQLSMTSGLDDGGDVHCTIDTCLVYKADAATRWAYHNAPYTLLDSVVTAATGQSLNMYVYRELSSRIGLQGLFVTQGFNNVFVSTARGMARFGLLILNEGVWDATPIMTDTAYFRQMVTTSQQLNKSYGYLWWLNGKESFMLPQTQYVFPGPLLPHAPGDLIAAMGKNGQILNVVSSQGLLVVRMGDSPDNSAVPVTFADDMWVLLNEVITPSQGASHGIAAARWHSRVRWTARGLETTVASAGFVSFEVRNLCGQIVAVYRKWLSVGTTILPLRTRISAPGLYVVTVRDETGARRFSAPIQYR